MLEAEITFSEVKKVTKMCVLVKNNHGKMVDENKKLANSLVMYSV